MLFPKKKLKVRLFGDPILAARAKPVEVIDDELKDLSQRMIQTMYDSNGIGLAGNQVGIPIRMVVIHVEQDQDENGNPLPFGTPGEMELIPKMPVTLINPEIVSFSEDNCSYNEGCLSVPKLYADVIRPSRVVLKAKLIDGTEVCTECGGLLARCIQHELDHLDGIVFVQKAEEESYKAIQNAVDKLVHKNAPRSFKVKRLV